MKEKLWKDILDDWEHGIYKDYPKSKTNPFMWRTSKVSPYMSNTFKEEYINCDMLDVESDYSAYDNQLNKKRNEFSKYAIHFWNLSGNTLLVIPTPRKRKNFSSIKQFTDNASKLHKREFWKYASKVIKLELKKGYGLYINTHGKGVPYFHLRISRSPKYYSDSKLK